MYAAERHFHKRRLCCLLDHPPFSCPRHHTRWPDRYTSPPVLSCELSSEKTKKLKFRRPTWLCALTPTLFTDLTFHQPLRSFDTWTYQRPLFIAVCASRTVRNSSKLLNTSLHFTVSLYSSLLQTLETLQRTLRLLQSPSCWTLLWSSHGNLFITPTDICCILIRLHHPLTVWSIRCGMFFFALLFSAFRFSLLCEPPLVHAIFFSFVFQSSHSVYQPSTLSFFIFFSSSLQFSWWLVQESHQTPCLFLKPTSKNTQSPFIRKPFLIS